MTRLSRRTWLSLAAGAALLRRRLRRRRRKTGPDAFTLDPSPRMVGVGPPEPHRVRVWLRTDAPGPHEVELSGPKGLARGRFVVPDEPEHDGTFAVTWPDDVGGAALEPLTPYRVRVRRADGTPVGSARFTTPPRSVHEAPAEVTLGVASCHQPFDEQGRLDERHLTLLRHTPAVLREVDARVLLLLGDQMYADLPYSRSLVDPDFFARVAPPGRRALTDCTREEVRALYQRRYRAFWAVEGWRALHAALPTVCMLDDHEVVDNFGSDTEHATARWANVRAGALDAYHDWQALRCWPRGDQRPAAFPVRFAHGPVAGLVLDLRSQRVAEPERIRVMGEDQWALLARFLHEEADRPVLVLGLSVPLVHAPGWLVDAAAQVAPDGSAVHDRWSHPALHADRDRLVHLLHEHRVAHPGQHLVLVSGDVHVGTIAELRLGDAPPVHQLVSSALSNLEATTLRLGSALLPSGRPSFTTADGLHVEGALLPDVAGRHGNPCTALNLGLVTVGRDRDRWRVRLRLVSAERARPHRPAVVHDTGWLGR